MLLTQYLLTTSISISTIVDAQLNICIDLYYQKYTLVQEMTMGDDNQEPYIESMLTYDAHQYQWFWSTPHLLGINS